MSHYFIAGIDTEVGKTAATGLLGRWFRRHFETSAVRVGTMKIVETGVTETDISADIQTHRKLMDMNLQAEDIDGTTCPYRFRLPASPHLSAALENREIVPEIIIHAFEKLQKQFDTLLVEGVGGLLVPLSPTLLALDLVRQMNVPVILVTSGRLGSINHTLLSLEALATRRIPLAGLVYNHFCNTEDIIRRDTLDFFRRHLEKQGRPDAVVEMPAFDPASPPDVDFSSLFL